MCAQQSCAPLPGTYEAHLAALQAQAKTGYQWWATRLRRAFELYDETRIDHFRAFAGACAGVCNHDGQVSRPCLLLPAAHAWCALQSCQLVNSNHLAFCGTGNGYCLLKRRFSNFNGISRLPRLLATMQELRLPVGLWCTWFRKHCCSDLSH